MIENPEEVELMRRKHEREHPLTLEQKYAILNAMYEEVKLLNRLTSGSAEGRMKYKLAIARMLNAGV
jgi:hypothetical protein